MNRVLCFHAHIYYDESTFEQARQLIEAARNQFSVSVGHMHKKPVGPHPCWSCQLGFGPALFGEVVLWLALNREGLVIFIHPETGNDLKDHLDHAIWMGEVKPIKSAIFKK